MEKEIDKIKKLNFSKLYGPERSTLRDHCKSLSTQDGVGDALRSGESDAATSEWITSTKHFHKGDYSATKDNINNNINNKNRNDNQSVIKHQETHLTLGFEQPPHQLGTTAGEFKWHKNHEVIKRQVADNTIHIPDFCPTLTAQVKPIKESVYTRSFHVDPSVPRPVPKPYKERKKYTNDLRETHFCLGTWHTKNTSETKHSIGFENNTDEEEQAKRFTGSARGDSLSSFSSSSSAYDRNTNSMVDRNRHESKVFRDGDWNRTDRKSISSSVTRKDFVDPPPYPTSLSSLCGDGSSELKFTHEFTKPNYHRATHFDLGSASSGSDASLYRKDFAVKPLTFAFDRDRACRELGHSNPTLELFPKGTRQSFITTKDTKFKDHGTDHLLSAMRDRNGEVFAIKQRNGRDSHQIYRNQMSSPSPPLPSARSSLSQDDDHYPQGDGGGLPTKRLISMSSSDFRRPPLTDNNKCTIKVPVNNHICGVDYDTMLSEARDKYKTHQSFSARQVHQECHERRRDNKSTHFVFGSSGTGSPLKSSNSTSASMIKPNCFSEQASQFRQRPPLDPSTRAAGKTMLKGKEYSHLLQQVVGDGNDGVSRPKSSFMIDFEDPWKGNIDCTQTRFHKGLHAKHPAVATSHLFHTGHGPNSGKYDSTTFCDFTSPIDQMLSQQKKRFFSTNYCATTKPLYSIS